MLAAAIHLAGQPEDKTAIRPRAMYCISVFCHIETDRNTSI